MSEVPLFPWWVTAIVYLWVPIGPIVGIALGHWLLRSWERKRWLADNRKEEYRRLLTALNKLNVLMLDWYRGGSPAKLQRIGDAIDEISMAFNTSLFIGEFLEQSKVADDLLSSFKKLMDSGSSFAEYHKEYWNAVNLIRAAAKKTAL
jgi:hypothetical protein